MFLLGGYNFLFQITSCFFFFFFLGPGKITVTPPAPGGGEYCETLTPSCCSVKNCIACNYTSQYVATSTQYPFITIPSVTPCRHGVGISFDRFPRPWQIKLPIAFGLKRKRCPLVTRPTKEHKYLLTYFSTINYVQMSHYKPFLIFTRPLAMRKDGIQTRKRKPKKSGNGTKPPQDGSKKDELSSPGMDGKDIRIHMIIIIPQLLLQFYLLPLYSFNSST